MKKDKPNHYVFVDPDFISLCQNLIPWTRNDNIFVCISVHDSGNYLDIVAVHNKFPEVVDNIHIWIPTRFVQTVLWDSYEKDQLGFRGSKDKVNKKTKK